jgi:hypothetical protein
LIGGNLDSIIPKVKNKTQFKNSTTLKKQKTTDNQQNNG